MGTNYNQVDWYTNFRITIAASESRKISKLGKYITILTNSTAEDPRIQINGQNGGKIPSGLSLELPTGENFDKLELVNESAAPMTLEVAISNGKIIDSRTVLSGALTVQNTIATPIYTTKGANTTTYSQTTITSAVTTVLNARTQRVRGKIKNIGSVPVFIGATTATKTTGYRLDPNDEMEVFANDSFKAVTAGSTNGEVSYIDEYNT